MAPGEAACACAWVVRPRRRSDVQCAGGGRGEGALRLRARAPREAARTVRLDGEASPLKQRHRASWSTMTSSRPALAGRRCATAAGWGSAAEFPRLTRVSRVVAAHLPPGCRTAYLADSIATRATSISLAAMSLRIASSGAGPSRATTQVAIIPAATEPACAQRAAHTSEPGLGSPLCALRSATCTQHCTALSIATAHRPCAHHARPWCWAHCGEPSLGTAGRPIRPRVPRSGPRTPGGTTRCRSCPRSHIPPFRLRRMVRTAAPRRSKRGAHALAPRCTEYVPKAGRLHTQYVFSPVAATAPPPPPSSRDGICPATVDAVAAAAAAVAAAICTVRAVRIRRPTDASPHAHA